MHIARIFISILLVLGLTACTTIDGRVFITHLEGETPESYCGHRYEATFESNDPDLRLLAVVYDFNEGENVEYTSFAWEGGYYSSSCEGYGVARENFGGLFVYNYPDIIPIVHIYPDNQQDPEQGIKTGERTRGVFKLKKREATATGIYANAEDMVGTKVRLDFSDETSIWVMLKESGDFFTVSGSFSYP